MAWGNGSGDFPITVPKATQADWSYRGDDWGRSSSSIADEENKPFFDLKSNTDFLSAPWAATQKSPDLSYTSYQPASSTHSHTAASTGILGWNLDENLSALLQDNLKLLDSVSTEVGSGVRSCLNQQFDLSELELQTIGNLLPDDDDLFSSALSELEGSAMANYTGENEELDLFSSGGGLELENDLVPNKGPKKAEEAGPTPSVGEHPHGEHPSRTLFVRNINSSVEDAELRALFEQYGDIRTLYTACKHRGFVMISYYDIRGARSAMRALQNKSLRRRKLDIHFSIPKDNPPDKDVNQGTLVVFNLDASVSNDELRQIFGVYGEVKEIRETPHKRHHKFIEFYDVRAAEAALRALNRCDIAGKRIKLEPSRPGGARRSLMQHLSNGPELDDSLLFKEFISSPLAKSAPVQAAFTDCLFLEKDPVHETSQYLKLMGLGMHPPAGHQETSSHQLVNGVDPLHYSPAALSAIRARMLSEHILKMGATGLSKLSSIESLYKGSMLSETRSMERLPINGVLCNNLNSVYPKEGGHRSLWPYVPVRSSCGIDGFSPHGDIMSLTHRVGDPMPVNHHIGSAPVTAFPYLDSGLKTYAREPFDSMNGASLSAALGFDGRHALESPIANSLTGFTANPIFSKGVADSCAYSNLWSLSQSQKANFFPKTLHESLPGQSEWVVDRGRGRKTDSGVSLHDKKQYELDIHRILCGEDLRTTLMIKNIPNKYTSKMLLATIDEHHKGTYDFIYLPIDFKNKCNVGYAFINMTEPSRIVAFYQAFNGKRWEKFNSEKVASLAYARIQGKAALIAHFQNSSLMNEDKRCRPILFHSGGPNVGDQEPFPIGNNPRMRTKARGSSRHHQGSPIGSASKELSYGF